MSTENIKLSVLVTFHNQKEYIETALNSILNQKVNFKYEVLIGLDDNDRESELIINKYESMYSNFRLFKFDNSNLDTINIIKASRNRHNLLKNATGEYFCMLDGDDFYNNPFRFQKLVDILDHNQEYVAVAHDYVFYDDKEKEEKQKSFLSNKEIIITAEDYLEKKYQLSNWCFIFRNIFYKAQYLDIDFDFFNDSTIVHYMLRYGDFFYLPENMISYRINIDSIYSSLNSILKKVYSLLCIEINHSVLPMYEKEMCTRNKSFFRSFFKLLKNVQKFDSDELLKIKQVASEKKCYFTYSLLDYKNLSFKQKANLYLNIFNYVYRNIYPIKKKTMSLIYFKTTSNFGDVLNLYVLQRIFNIPVKYGTKRTGEILCIGSLADMLLKQKNKLYMPRKPLLVFGSGFISEHDYSRYYEKINRKVNILALRGLKTKKRMEKAISCNLDNIPLGDPGLLASLLIDTSQIKKKYEAGIICHFDDDNELTKNNIKLSNYKFIDIRKNPIQFLREILECKVIFSSAMHGLIAADSFGIPNQRLIFSDKLLGGDYKFDDYYSIYQRNIPTPIDLRNSILTDENIQFIKNEYEKLNFSEVIEKVNSILIETSKKI